MDDFSETQRRYFDPWSYDLFSLYVVTQGGAIRRVSVPNGIWPSLTWLMRPHTDVEPEYFDKHACAWADREKCTYAEALTGLVESYFESEDVCAAYVRDASASEDRKRLDKDFEEEQARRERLWREAHNEWRKDLPPALD